MPIRIISRMAKKWGEKCGINSTFPVVRNGGNRVGTALD